MELNTYKALGITRAHHDSDNDNSQNKLGLINTRKYITVDILRIGKIRLTTTDNTRYIKNPNNR